MHTQSNLSLPLGRTVLRLVIWRGGEPRFEGIWPFTAFLAAALSPRSFLRVTSYRGSGGWLREYLRNACSTPIPGLLKVIRADRGRFSPRICLCLTPVVGCALRSHSTRFLEERNRYRNSFVKFFFLGFPCRIHPPFISILWSSCARLKEKRNEVSRSRG